MRCKTKQEKDSRSADLRVSSHHGAVASVADRRKHGTGSSSSFVGEEIAQSTH